MGLLCDPPDPEQIRPRGLADNHAGKLLDTTVTRRWSNPYTQIVEPTLIAAALGALALATASLWWRARRDRRKELQRTAGLRAELGAARQALASLRVGEREAAWAATAATQRLHRSMIELDKSSHDVDRLQGDLDDLRTRLGAADRDLDRLRADFSEASTRCTILEGDLGRSRAEAAGTATRLDELEGIEQRLYSVVRERDRLSAGVQRGEQLEAELAALGRVYQELSATRAENATLRARVTAIATSLPDDHEIEHLGSEVAHLRSQLSESDRRATDAREELQSARRQVTDLQAALSSREVDDRLVASEAMKQDLALQLAALSATRSAEQAAATDRISRLERLHGTIAQRDGQIAALEQQIVEANTPGPGPGPGGTATYAEWDSTLREQVAASVQAETGRLRDRVEHLRLVIAEKERLLQEWVHEQNATGPGRVFAPVTAIKGIGPVIAAILDAEGISSIPAIAALSDSDIDRLGEKMPVYPGRIRRDDWVGQARALVG